MARQQRSLLTCLGRLAVAAGIFVAGIVVGASVALQSNLAHDEKIRDEVRREAIEHGLGWIEVNPASGYEHFHWIDEKPFFPSGGTQR
jgi:hypothetical protein